MGGYRWGWIVGQEVLAFRGAVTGAGVVQGLQHHAAVANYAGNPKPFRCRRSIPPPVPCGSPNRLSVPGNYDMNCPQWVSMFLRHTPCPVLSRYACPSQCKASVGTKSTENPAPSCP